MHIACLITFTLLFIAVHATTEIREELDDLRAQVARLHRRLQMSGDSGMNHEGHHHCRGPDMTVNHESQDHGNHESQDHDDHDDHGDHHGGHGASSASNTIGHGVFFTSGKDTTILFEGWTTDSMGKYIGACIFVFFLGIVLEAMTTLRMVYPNHVGDGSIADFMRAQTPRTGATKNDAVNGQSTTLTWREHSIKTILYMIGITMAYLLMLIIMTFNAGLFICAVLGLSTGYFMFGNARSVARPMMIESDSAECCHNVA